MIHSLLMQKCSPAWVEGTAIFPGGAAGRTPTAACTTQAQSRAASTNIFLAGTTENVPHVRGAEKAVLEDLGEDAMPSRRATASWKFRTSSALFSLTPEPLPGWTYDVGDTSFFLARDTIRRTGESKVMSLWREKLFTFLGPNAAHPAEYYSLRQIASSTWAAK